MALTNDEFEALLADQTKRIEGDIEWSDDEDHSPSVEFRVAIQSDPGYTLALKGSFNRLTKSLSFTLFDPRFGRIYGLDIGKDHENPSGEKVGEKHKHRWSEVHRDKNAYVPEDITAARGDVVTTWNQFCAEAKIKHVGKMRPPEPTQEPLFL